MKIFLHSLFIFWIVTFFHQNAPAECGAGTVIYFRFKGEVYLLLADHSLSHQRARGWSGFGGYCGADSVEAAAARETEEETKGFYRRDEIRARLGSSPKIRVGDFTTFFIGVDYVPAIVINNQKPLETATGYSERGPYAWVPFSVVRQAMAAKGAHRLQIPDKYLPPDKRSSRLFEPFVTSLLAAKTAGILPW